MASPAVQYHPLERYYPRYSRYYITRAVVNAWGQLLYKMTINTHMAISRPEEHIYVKRALTDEHVI